MNEATDEGRSFARLFTDINPIAFVILDPIILSKGILPPSAFVILSVIKLFDCCLSNAHLP